MARRDSNLSNPKADPEHAGLDVTSVVHFDLYRGPVPKGNLERWLTALPESAKVTFEGIRAGKAYFEAKWSEQR